MIRGLDIGLAFDLRSDFHERPDGPDDRLEEYDSDATVDAIVGALVEAGHRPRRLGGGRRFLEHVLEHPPQLVFNLAEGRGTRSREAHVPSVCEMLDIPVTHSDPLTAALTLDKAMAKRVVEAAGVGTPCFAVVAAAAQAEDLRLRFPLIAKPLFEGSSIGVRKHSRVRDLPALRAEVARLAGDYGQPVLVEEFCAGVEFTVGVLGEGASARVIAAMEIAPKRARVDEFVYSLEVKRNWEAEVEYHVPPRVPARTIRAVEDVALAAYRALGCRDIARVDVRLDAADEPRFLEVNPLPGLNPVTGDIVILAARVGLAYPELIARIVANARVRYGI